MPRLKKTANQEPPVPKKEPTEPTQDTAATPKKQIKFRSAIHNTSFNIFDHKKFQEKQTADLMAKAGLGNRFSTAAATAHDYLPIPWLAMQYVLGRPGIAVNSICEFTGGEGVGKSSLVYALLGYWTRHNIPCYYINSEGKELEPFWKSRLVGADAALNGQVQEAIERQDIHTLNEMDVCIQEWIRIKREEQGVPKSVPLVVAIDSITKLMNPSEAEVSDISGDGGKKKLAGVGEISQKPGVTAKWHHMWTRQLPKLMLEQNVTLILVSGQNQDMDMGSASAFIPKAALAKRNKTRTGGVALNQSDALLFTMTYRSTVTNSKKEPLGKEICLFCEKNSYGPSAREIVYTLKNDTTSNFKDTEESIGQAVDMDLALCQLLLKQNMPGISANKNRFSCEQLGLYSLSPAQLVTAIQANPDVFKEVTERLSIHGWTC